MLRNEGDRLLRVVACAPRREYFEVADPASHNIGDIADPKKATDQHRKLQAVLRRAGVRVVNLTELTGHPNSVFARDAGLVTPDGYIKLRMGLETRRGEEEWMASALDSLGLPCAGKIEDPGTVEGGDVILAGEAVFVGLSARTNRSGLRQLSRLLVRMGFEVRSLRLPSDHFHIGGLMSAIGPRSVICCRDFFPGGFFDGYEVIKIPCPEDSSANVIALGNKRVVVEQACRGTARALREAGFVTHLVDLSEFVKGRGGPTCLIMPVDRGQPAQKSNADRGV
jgi:dimethylargininase